MEVTPEVRRLVHAGSAAHTIRDRIRQTGFKTLRDEGVLLALAGKTSLDEVLRVTHNDERETPVIARSTLAQERAA